MLFIIHFSVLCALALLSRIILVTCEIDNPSDDNNVTVIIREKEFIGFTEKLEDKTVNIFLGIPYAKPPIGDLRFKKPVPLTHYQRPLNATQWPNNCHQPLLSKFLKFRTFRNRNFSEDCLYLNIWSPNESSEATINNSTLKTVLFFIHGGSLILGSSSMYTNDGSMLSIKGDVVVVTINYRLGPFGFLYSGSDDAPGNVGLWDQALALKWVSDNIEHFGGDPNKITVFGQSAGGWSTSILLLSPITRHLFRNAIIMSGAAISNFELQDTVSAKNMWRKVAKSFDCEMEFDASGSVQCLRSIDPAKLINSSLFENNPHYNSGTLIYNHKALLVYGDELLPQKPVDMIESGNYKKNVNLLVGTTEDEGSLMLIYNLDHIKYSLFKPVNISKSDVRQKELKEVWSKLVFTGQENEIDFEDVYRLYIAHIPENNYNLIRKSMGIAFGDYTITCKTVEFAKMIYDNDRAGSKVYQYVWSAKIDGFWTGATHGQDRKYCFGMPFTFPYLNTTHERNKSQRMIEIITHFAKYGKPPAQEGIEWPGYYIVNDKLVTPYYEIANQTDSINGNFGFGYKYECEHLWNKYIKL